MVTVVAVFTEPLLGEFGAEERTTPPGPAP